MNDEFDANSQSTIGASYLSKQIMVDGRDVRFQIWDTAGQEKYHSLAPMYYRGAAAAIVVYDITSRGSFQTLKTWVQELRSFGPVDILVAVAGNKLDLAEHRAVPQEEAEAYAEEIGGLYIETSALTATNVNALFLDICRKLPASLPTTSAGTGAAVGVIGKPRYGQEAHPPGCCS